MSDNTSHTSKSEQPNLMLQRELTGVDFLRELPPARLWRWLRRGKARRGARAPKR